MTKLPRSKSGKTLRKIELEQFYPVNEMAFLKKHFPSFVRRETTDVAQILRDDPLDEKNLLTSFDLVGIY